MREHRQGRQKAGDCNDDSGDKIESAIKSHRREAVGHLYFAAQVRDADRISERLPKYSKLPGRLCAEAKSHQPRE